MSIHINKFQYINGKYVQQNIPYKKNYCRDCKHFNKNGEVCRLFAEIDMVNGNENIVRASEARSNTSMCGFGATFFDPINKFKVIKNDVEK